MLVSLFEALFVCCIVYAMITDALYLRIPNGVSLTLLAAFALYACYLMATQPSLLFSARLFILAHLFVGLAVFAGGVLIYTVKWIGGGDAKLLGAVGLWAGPDHATEFLITTGMLGILLAGSILVVRQIVASRPVLSTPTAIQPIVGWARAGICPYGLAIGVAALTVVPKMFYG